MIETKFSLLIYNKEYDMLDLNAIQIYEANKR